MAMKFAKWFCSFLLIICAVAAVFLMLAITERHTPEAMDPPRPTVFVVEFSTTNASPTVMPIPPLPLIYIEKSIYE